MNMIVIKKKVNLLSKKTKLHQVSKSGKINLIKNYINHSN